MAEPEIQPATSHELSNVPTTTPYDAHVTEPQELGSAEAQDMTVPKSRFKQLTSLTALIATELIVALNTTIVATAVPTICTELGSAEGYAWIGAAYLVGTAAFAPIWAKLSDIWGRKIILLCAVGGFMGSSIVCALSVDMTMLILGRAIQGAFGGGAANLVAIVISDLFSMRRRSLYMGLLEVTWGFAGGIGPVLGGAFAQYITWRWIFWVMLPPCGLALILLTFALDVHNPRTGVVDGLAAIDWAGSVCIISLLVMFLLGVSFGGVEFPWNSPTVICLIAIGAVMGAGFIFSEKKLARYPIVDLSIFTKRSNLAVLFVGFVQTFVFNAAEFYLPFFFQSAKGLSPVRAGAYILPSVLGTAFSSSMSGLYMNRTGRYMELFWIGLVLMGAGQGSYLAWTPASSWALMVGTQLLSGIGTGLLFTPLMLAIQASVVQNSVATATATMGLVRNIAMVMSIICGQVIFQHSMDQHQGLLLATGLDETLINDFQGANAAANVDLISTIQDPAQRLVVEQAFSESLTGLWIMDVSLIGLALLACAFIVKTKLSKEHVETRTGLQEEKKASNT